MFYIEKDNKIILSDTDLSRLAQTLKFIPDLNESDIKETDKEIVNGVFTDTDEYFEELKKEGSGIIFTGFVQGRTLGELYSNAYIYTLPSELEGMPLSLLEAMSYGNCCLVSDIEECGSVIEDKGVTFRKSNAEDLREKMQWLLDNKEVVQKYKNEAREFICRKYNWNDVVDKTLELYYK